MLVGSAIATAALPTHSRSAARSSGERCVYKRVSAGLQCGVAISHTDRKGGIQIEKEVRRSHTYRKEGTQPAQITIASKKHHKPRARRPSPTAVVFRYTICGRALLRYSNVAARNTRRSVSQPVYTRRSHASGDARAAMRRAMRRPGRASASRAQRLLLQIRRRDGYVQAGRWRWTELD